MRRPRRVRTLPPLLLLAVALGGCGGGSGTTEAAEERAQLELLLEKTSVGVCNGNCRTYHAMSATCLGDSVEIEGRRYFRCRVEYESKGGHTPAPEVICAALQGEQRHVARPREDCR